LVAFRTSAARCRSAVKRPASKGPPRAAACSSPSPIAAAAAVAAPTAACNTGSRAVSRRGTAPARAFSGVHLQVPAETGVRNLRERWPRAKRDSRSFLILSRWLTRGSGAQRRPRATSRRSSRRTTTRGAGPSWPTACRKGCTAFMTAVGAEAAAWAIPAAASWGHPPAPSHMLRVTAPCREKGLARAHLRTFPKRLQVKKHTFSDRLRALSATEHACVCL